MSEGRVRAVRIFHGALALLLAVVFILQIALNVHEGRSLVNMFSYFTIQSNLLVLVTATLLAVRPDVSGRWWRALRLAALSGITVTGIVYATVIAPYVNLTGQASVYNHVFHYVVPITSVIGFVVVGPRQVYHRKDLILVIGWPVLWLVYTMVRAAVSDPNFTGFGEPRSRYPYRFLDVDQVGSVEVIASIAVITLLIVGIGLAYIWLEHRLDARAERVSSR